VRRSATSGLPADDRCRELQRSCNEPKDPDGPAISIEEPGLVARASDVLARAPPIDLEPVERRWDERAARRIGRMLRRRERPSPLAGLTPREREVLAAIAEGLSNQGIGEALVETDAAVEKHIRSIFQKLGLGPTPNEHRCVLAVVTYLRGSAADSTIRRR
jgi:DNA-binding NarL/FixJ family response regulator